MTEKKVKYRKKRPAAKFVMISLLFVFLATGIYSAFQIIDSMKDYKVGEDEYNEIARDAVIINPEKNKNNNESSPNANNETEEEAAFSVDYDALYAINKEYIGWIYIPDTKINYPMVRAKNNDKYLHRSFKGQYAGCGTIFMDYRNNKDYTDSHTVIYGHLMKNHTMFYDVRRFEKKDYYDSHRYIYIYVDGGYYVYKTFSFFQTTATSEVYTFKFDGVDKFNDYCAMLQKKSKFGKDVTLSFDSKVITLSTCVDASSDKRWVLHAVQTEFVPVPKN